MNNILQFVWFKDLINWSVRDKLSTNHSFNFDSVKLDYVLNDLTLDRKIVINDNVEYEEPTISSKTNTISVRKKALGVEFKVKKRIQIKKNDLVFAKLHTQNGLFAFSEQNFVSTSTFIPCSFDDKKITKGYLSIILKRFLRYLSSNDSVGRETYKTQDILNLQVPLPTLEIQQQLVKNYQDKINLAKRQEVQFKQKEVEIEVYLYKELGIELPKEEQQNKGILQFISFKDLNYWDYDKNCNKFSYTSIFNKVKLNDICDISRGGSPRPIQNFITNDKNGVNWIKIGDTKGVDKYIYKVKEKIRPEGVKYSRSVNKGDFILSNSMSFGKPYIMKTTGCIHDGWLLLRLYKNLINEDYLYHILGSSFMFNMFSHSTIGTVVQNLNIQTVKITKIPLPPLKIQNKIAEHIQNIKNEMQVLKQQAEQNKKNALNEFEAEIFTNKMSMENNNAS
jgi:type I restriction enzyme S subunit